MVISIVFIPLQYTVLQSSINVRITRYLTRQLLEVKDHKSQRLMFIVVDVHVGNEYSRREYLILGETIDQASEACDAAKHGEIRASVDAIIHLNKGQPLKNQLRLEIDAKSIVIASRREVFFQKKRKKAWTMNGRIRKPLKANTKFTIPFDKMDYTSLKYFNKILSCYVHPVVVGHEADQINNLASHGDGQIAQERYRAEAELRSVFTIFIKPKIDPKLSNDSAENMKTFGQLNDILNAVTSVLDSFKGHLRQYIVDDKGRFSKDSVCMSYLL